MNATNAHTPGPCLLIRPDPHQGVNAGSWRTATVNTYGSVEDAEYDKRDVPSLKYAVVVPVALALAAPALLAACEEIDRLSSSPLQSDYVAPSVVALARAALRRARGA